MDSLLCWDPELNTKEKVNRAPASTSLCFLTVDAIHKLLLPDFPQHDELES